MQPSTTGREQQHQEEMHPDRNAYTPPTTSALTPIPPTAKKPVAGACLIDVGYSYLLSARQVKNQLLLSWFGLVWFRYRTTQCWNPLTVLGEQSQRRRAPRPTGEPQHYGIRSRAVLRLRQPEEVLLVCRPRILRGRTMQHTSVVVTAQR